MTLQLQKDTKKNEGRNGEEAGLKEAITIFQRWNKMTATDTKYYQTEN